MQRESCLWWWLSMDQSYEKKGNMGGAKLSPRREEPKLLFLNCERFQLVFFALCDVTIGWFRELCHIKSRSKQKRLKELVRFEIPTADNPMSTLYIVYVLAFNYEPSSKFISTISDSGMSILRAIVFTFDPQRLHCHSVKDPRRTAMSSRDVSQLHLLPVSAQCWSWRTLKPRPRPLTSIKQPQG